MKRLIWLLVASTAILLGNGAASQERAPLVTAILIYNNFPDSTFRLMLREGDRTAPDRTIALPMSLLAVEMTRAEAGSLVAAIGAFLTPIESSRASQQPDRADRFDRLMRSLESCPGALASITIKLEALGQHGQLISLLREVRTHRPEYAAIPSGDCATSL